MSSSVRRIETLPVPMPITYFEGDATQPSGEGRKILVHVCNDAGGWGKGFVVAISKRWPDPERRYREWHRSRDEHGQPFALGAVQFVEVGQNLTVANLIGQHGMGIRHGQPPIRNEAIRAGLREIASFALKHQASVHMPRIGCGLAGGKWEEIVPMIDAELAAKCIAVTVYDFPGK